uniref:C2H2-type domain-containing protein n=1 Tax=Erpetoichthys calabaricus TaxID=27687 RepID=A0A8C4XHF0_ERPCA
MVHVKQGIMNSDHCLTILEAIKMNGYENESRRLPQSSRYCEEEDTKMNIIHIPQDSVYYGPTFLKEPIREQGSVRIKEEVSDQTSVHLMGDIRELEFSQIKEEVFDMDIFSHIKSEVCSTEVVIEDVSTMEAMPSGYLGGRMFKTLKKSVSCAKCGKTYTQLSSLKRHQRSHAKVKLYVCGDLASLSEHQRSHAGEQPYSCINCGKTFKQETNMKVGQRVHTGEKPFSCPECGKIFPFYDDFKFHQRVHNGAKKSYICTDCWKTFHYLQPQTAPENPYWSKEETLKW